MADKKAEKEAAKAAKLEKKRLAAEEKAKAKAEAKAKKDAAKAEKKKAAKEAKAAKGKGKTSPTPSSTDESAEGDPSPAAAANGDAEPAADDGFNPNYKAGAAGPLAAAPSEAEPAAADAAPQAAPPAADEDSGAAAKPEPEPEPEPEPAAVAVELAPAAAVPPDGGAEAEAEVVSPTITMDAGPPAAAAAAASAEDGDGDDGDDGGETRAQSNPKFATVPDRRPGGGLTRTRSARRSVLGAPMSKATGMTVVEMAPQPEAADNRDEPDESRLGAEVVEDEADDRVGEMTEGNSQKTAQFLSDQYNTIKSKMGVLDSDGTLRGYSMAYQEMGMVGRDQPASLSMAEANRLKNRYGNIMAYDHSRVVLDLDNGDPDTSYVNANWIDGYGRKQAYIASQGPVPNSFISHWRMIWQYKIETIVMVTHEVEGNRMKCHRYWPDPTSRPPVKTLQFGQIHVTHVASTPHKHYIVRDFEISFQGETRKVKQFAYTSWPDHGVPLTTHELLGFRNAINASITRTDVPQLIHCSAGVGRTGTYIAIDRIMKQCLDMGGEIDVDAIVKDMRMARNFMVQTEVQYMFIYRAVLDAVSELLSGESSKAQELQVMDDVRHAAEQARQEEAARTAAEQAEIEVAKKELMARSANSAEAAAKVVGASIQDRIKMLESSEERWLKAYTQSLEEWNERNKFEAEEYDLTSALTPLQSRLEALRQKGMSFE